MPDQEKEQLVAQLEAAKAALLKEQTEKSGLVEEIKTERQKKQEAEKLFKEAQEKGSQMGDPKEIFKGLIEEQTKEQVKKNLTESKENFKKEFKEFAPDNDPTGLKYQKFESELRKFNFDGLESREQFTARLKEVYEFMNRKEHKGDDSINYYGGTPGGGGTEPIINDGAGLHPKEVALIKEMGITREKFIEIRSKRPGYVRSLLGLD